MAINEKINEYSERNMHIRESENAHRLKRVGMSMYLSSEPLCAIKRGLVQNKEHKHSSHVTKSSTKSSKARMALHSKIHFYFKGNLFDVGPPP